MKCVCVCVSGWAKNWLNEATRRDFEHLHFEYRSLSIDFLVFLFYMLFFLFSFYLLIREARNSSVCLWLCAVLCCARFTNAAPNMLASTKTKRITNTANLWDPTYWINFLRPNAKAFPHTHTKHWESLQESNSEFHIPYSIPSFGSFSTKNYDVLLSCAHTHTRIHPLSCVLSVRSSIPPPRFRFRSIHFALIRFLKL